MDLQWITRVLLAAFCGLQGVATIILDLNRTHAAHPQWLGHARFHVVWQTVTVACLSIVEIILLWLPGPFVHERFYLVALLASVPMIGFFAALSTRRFYGGELYDPRGIPPVRLMLRTREVKIDLNFVAEVAGVTTVVILVAVYHVAKERS